MSDEHFLSRWSRLKIEQKQTPDPLPAPPAPPAETLPPVESLTPDSDFSGFLREGVEEHVKRAALKTLFQDPRFNVMDGLDVYIDDYSKPDPLPEGWLEKMNQVARLGEYKAPEEKPEEARVEAVEMREQAPNPDAEPAFETEERSDTETPGDSPAE